MVASSPAAAGMSPFVKPAVPPRPRSILSDGKKHNNLNNSSSSVMNAKNHRGSSSSGIADQYAMDLMPSKEADLSNEKCEGIRESL